MIRNLRTRYFIDPQFQLSFLRHTMIGAVAMTLIFLVANLVCFWRFKQLGADMGLPSNHIYFRFLSDQVSMMSTVFLVTAIVVISLIVVSGILFSHKIAGPIQRLCAEARAMKESGQFRPIRARNRDYFPQLQEAFNETIEIATSRK